MHEGDNGNADKIKIKSVKGKDDNPMKFKLLTMFFEKFKEKKGRQRHLLIKEFFDDNAFKKDRRYAFSLFRLTMPDHDKERGNYNLKESKLADLVADTLCLIPNERTRIKSFK